MTAAVAFLLACLVAPGAGPRFTVTEIEPEGDLMSFWGADMNGDGKADLLLAAWSESRGREILVYLQGQGGALSAVPDRRVDIKSDIIAIASADIREEPGDELLLLTRTACFSYSTARRGYARNARRLFNWNLICSIPDRKVLLSLPQVRDLDGDGRIEVLVPGFNDYGLFSVAHGQMGEECWRFQLSPRRRQYNSKPEHRLSVSLESGFQHQTDTPFTGLVSKWYGSDDTGGGQLLNQRRWIPAIHVAEINGDGQLDFMSYDPTGGQENFNVFLNKGDQFFSPNPDWSGKVPSDGALWVEDVNGDGRVDLIVGGARNTDGMKLRYFLNNAGRFAFEKPDRVMQFSGYGVEPEIRDLDGDGTPELTVSSYSISKLKALTDGSVNRTLLIYRADAERVFGVRPSFKIEESFSAKNFKGIGQRISMEADMEGRGTRSALLLDSEGALIARTIDSELTMATTPYWRFVPRKTILEFKCLSLNNDRRSDIVLRHIRSLTVLVSR